MEINTIKKYFKKICYIFACLSTFLSIILILLSILIIPLLLVSTEYLVGCMVIIIIGTVIGIMFTYKEKYDLIVITCPLIGIGGIFSVSLMGKGSLSDLLHIILIILIVFFNHKLNNKILILICILVLVHMILLLFSLIVKLI